MSWLLNTKKHYKIWFSDIPDIFLGIENQLRFIRAREKNPDITLGFVYSSSILSDIARASLNKFCTQFNIIPMDFDADLPNLLHHELDRRIYDIAKQEIHNKAGVLASASDCVRTLIPLIEQFGIYSDFDVGIEFADIPKQMAIKYPVILPVDYREHVMAINLDFIATAYCEQNEKHLHPEAIECIRNIQISILNRYKIPLTAFITPTFRGLGTAVLADPLMLGVIEGFFRMFPSATIFDFRAYCKTPQLEHRLLLPKGDWALVPQPTSKKLSEHFLFLSVIYFSGGVPFAGIYETLIPALGFSNGPIGVQPSKQWSLLVKALEQSSLEANKLRKAVITRNNMSVGNLTERQAIKLGIRDGSWSQVGKAEMQQREQILSDAANTIGRVWKKTKSRLLTGNWRMNGVLHCSFFNPALLPENFPREIKYQLTNHLTKV